MALPTQIKATLGFMTYLTFVPVTNSIIHLSDSVRYVTNAKEYFEFSSGRILSTQERKYIDKLIHSQEKCAEESINPWIFFPGSFLWRRIEKPSLESFSNPPIIL